MTDDILRIEHDGHELDVSFLDGELFIRCDGPMSTGEFVSLPLDKAVILRDWLNANLPPPSEAG